jgi:hypothetical protein
LASLAGVLTVLAVVAGALAVAAPAGANDHNLRIREVFAGATTGQPGARFIELQLANSGQGGVTGNRIHVYNAAGTEVGAFAFTADLTNPADQASVLAATSQAASLFGVTPDLTMGAVVPPKGGQVCYEDRDPVRFIDCVAWGNFTGVSPNPTGDPFGPVSGILDGTSILRDITGGIDPNELDTVAGGVGPGGDDTDDSAADFDTADFDAVDFGPRNNADEVTTRMGSATVTGGELVFVAASGVKNKLTLAASGAFWRITDQVAPIDANAPCEQVTVNRVKCPHAAVSGLSIDAGDENDQITTADGIDASVDGGAGDDRITTKNGADSLAGALGRDILDGGSGPDTLDGGENQDTVTYERRIAGQPVVVDIDGAAGDDGGTADGAGDTVLANVENLRGGAGADTLTGSDGSNMLTGGAGVDELHGLAANDTIRAKGDGSNDTINCGAGPNDRLFADLGDIFPSPPDPGACEIVS